MTPPAAAAAARTMRSDILRDMSAREIAALVAARELAASEVMEHFAARLAAVNDRLNAVAVDLTESARKAAAEVDAALARGEKPGPLAGLPVTIKECFDLAGTASTFGLPERRDIIEDKDDPHIVALRAAGAIPLAKSNVPQLLIFTESDNPLYGRTNNPWDAERSCGGSSGGEAALIAAGASPLGLGNDIGGSLRIPAAFCGIAAIRPTAGRTPDHCAHGLPIGQRAIVSQAGPMARHVEDLALALAALDRARDPMVDPGPALGDPAIVDVARLRFASSTDDGEFPVAPAARRAVEEAARMLTAAGATAVPWQPPDLGAASELFFACLSADRGRAFMRMLRGNRIDPRIRSLVLTARMPGWLRGMASFALAALGQQHSATLLRRFASGSADDYWRAVEAMMNWRRAFARSLEEAEGGPIDLILCPAYAVPAQRHGASLLMPLPGAYAPLAPVIGFPAGVVPVTRVRAGEESERKVTRDWVERTARDSERGSVGLPIAVQVIARPWRDHVALAAMMTIEAAARKQPDYPTRPKL
jgi:Asp-tRNA(Asn)/Glu-tRNA(Gln) amidotransferase A subunit family amidase